MPTSQPSTKASNKQNQSPMPTSQPSTKASNKQKQSPMQHHNHQQKQATYRNKAPCNITTIDKSKPQTGYTPLVA
jgi:hypothetical protein